MTADLEQAPDLDQMGPVDYLVVAFPTDRMTGEAFPRLIELVDRGIIRILDLVFLRKDGDGTVHYYTNAPRVVSNFGTSYYAGKSWYGGHSPTQMSMYSYFTGGPPGAERTYLSRSASTPRSTPAIRACPSSCRRMST